MMMGFNFKWEECEGFNGVDNKSHTLTISNDHTFCIRTIENITFPGTLNPTYIDTTYITPTNKSLEECCKSILEKSYGNWWTGTERQWLDKLQIFIISDFSYKFPKTEAELEIILTLNGF